MTIYFQASELEDWEYSAAGINVGYAGGASGDNRQPVFVGINGASEDTLYLQSPTFSTGTTIWTRVRLGRFSSVSAGTIKFIKWYNGGTARFGFAAIGAGSSGNWNFGIYRWNGSSWVLLGTSDYLYSESSAPALDFYFSLGNPGRVSVYGDGVPIISVAGIDLSFISSLDAIRVQQNGGTSNMLPTYRYVIVADFNTINAQVRTKTPDANGTYTAWTTGAAFGNIDEVTPDANFASSATANQRFSFTSTDFSALGTNEVIENVRLSYQANRDAAGPQNINAFLRVSGTDYDGADQTLDVTATRRYRDWTTNPNTAAAWASAAAVNGIEAGLRSRT